MKSKLELFLTGFIQVCLVSANTYLIARSFYIGIFFLGFSISFVWSFNVKRVAFGTIWDRLAYSLGAALGSIIGLYLIKLFV